MQVTGIFGLASQQASWLSARQQTIAENIANANIPGYVPKDTEPFRALVERNPGALTQTNPLHMASSVFSNGIKRVEAKGRIGTAGESVSVETELMKSTEVRSGYEMNTAIVKAFHRMILTAAKA
jgi:flagellar basal-body rod protein FlgB